MISFGPPVISSPSLGPPSVEQCPREVQCMKYHIAQIFDEENIDKLTLRKKLMHKILTNKILTKLWLEPHLVEMFGREILKMHQFCQYFLSSEIHVIQ